MKIAVVVFPGTNCERETLDAAGRLFGHRADPIWHADTGLSGYDLVVLPGGFSYGDHLRAGAIARFSPIVGAVERFAKAGGLVLGICNGFQVLCEAGLLPGALLPNVGGSFVCSWVTCRVEGMPSPFTRGIEPGRVLRLPIAHGEGRYVAPPEEFAAIERRGQVLLRYCAPDGELADWANPNGSTNAIAGVCSEGGNIFGLMPHPERAADPDLPGQDGRALLAALLGAPITRELVGR
ncbi:MAG: phosphoribosylformylglycinamidine synthase I [Chloroflexi bacterium]|nr:phosphoribosylformylglycinamidine synthase I [Chloroflexota bacterium]